MVITPASVTLVLPGKSAKSALPLLIPSQVLTCALTSFQTACAIQGLSTPPTMVQVTCAFVLGSLTLGRTAQCVSLLGLDPTAM